MAVGPIFDVFFDVEVADSTQTPVEGAECTISDPGSGILVSGFTDSNGDFQVQIFPVPNQDVDVECTSGSTVASTSINVGDVDGETFTVELELPQLPQLIGGEIIPIETTSLLLISAQSSFVWILPLVLVGAGFSAYKIRHRF